MNSKQQTAGKTAQKTYSVRCNAFDLPRINAMQLAQGSDFVGWRYANKEETEVEVFYESHLVANTITINIDNLIVDLLSLFLRGFYTREEADRILTDIERRCA